MIRLVLSNGKLKSTMALFLAVIMMVQLLSGVDLGIVAEAATPDTLTLNGTVYYTGDSDWKDAIRPQSFDTSKMEIVLWIKFESGGSFSRTEKLQDTNADGNFHLSFFHDGNGGGSFTIANIPKSYAFGADKNWIECCYLKINNVDYYSNITTPKITFDEETGKATSDANMNLKAKTMPIRLTTSVIGEENTSTSFDASIKATNPLNGKSCTKNVCVSNGAATGTTVDIPIGLNYTIAQKSKESYTFLDYNLSYTYSGGDVNLQTGTKTLNTFKSTTTYGSNTVTRYNLLLRNAAQNSKIEWNVNWVDNYYAKRPTPSFKLQYSTDGKTYQDVTTSNIAKLGLSSVPQYRKVEDSISKNDNIKSYCYDNLPCVTVDGEAVTYKAVQTTSINEYIYEYDADDNTFYNTLKVKFKANIVWLDDVNYADQYRPTVAQVKGLLNLYSYTDTVYTRVNLSSSDIKVTDNRGSWALEITKALPQYDRNNNKITYVLVEGELDDEGNYTNKIETIKKTGYAGEDGYKVSYYNKGTTDAVSDRCFNGKSILHTSDSKYEFTSTKIWKDDSNVKRPKTRVTLWRYAKNGANNYNIDISESARVIAKNTEGQDIILSYILKTSDKTAAELGNVYSEEIRFDKSTIPNLADDYCIPKYDEEGNEYIYFIMESMEDLVVDKDGSYYESDFKVHDNKIQLKDIIDNGGTITSTRKGKVSIKINKIWNAASAISDFEGAKVEFKILGKGYLSDTYSVITPVDEEKAEITDFGVSKTRGTVEVLINPYDENGKRYSDFKVIESRINVPEYGDITLQYDSDDKSNLKFSVKGTTNEITNSGEIKSEVKEITNFYEGKCSSLDPVGLSVKYENVQSYVCEVENTIVTNKQYTFVTVWDEEVKPTKQTSYLTGTSVNGEKFAYQIVMYTNGKGTIYELDKDGKIIQPCKVFDYETNDSITTLTGRIGTGWIVKEIPGLPQYTEEGYIINYKIHDADYRDNDTDEEWVVSYNNTEQGTVMTNMFKDPPGDLLTASKIWSDDGDVLSRYKLYLNISTPIYKRVLVATPTPEANNEVESSATPEAATQAPTSTPEATQAPTPTPEATQAPTPTPEMTLVPDSTEESKIKLNNTYFWQNHIGVARKEHMGYTESTINEVLVGNDGKEYTSEPDPSYKSETTLEPELNRGVETGNMHYIKTEKHKVTTDKFQYDVFITRKVLMPKDSTFNVMSVSVENVRKEFVDITIKQQWQDNSNINQKRPSKAVFTLYEKAGQTREVTLYGEASKYNAEDNGKFSVKTDDDGICTWTYTIKGLPKFDERGILYKYNIEGLPKLYDENDNPIYYSNSVQGGDYTGTISYSYTKHKGDTLLNNDQIEYNSLCKLKSKTEFVVYQKWIDEAIGDSVRPDIYLSLYRYAENVSGPIAPEGTLMGEYANQDWTEGKDKDDFNWMITFKDLDKYDALGNKYVYYVKEKLNNEDKSSTDSNIGFKYITSYKNQGDKASVTDKAYKDCTIENRLNDSIVIKGEKIWKNIAGFDIKDLPVPIIKLYRKNRNEEEFKFDDAHLMNTIELTDGAKEFEFSKDKDDNYLPKYDEKGQLYIYYLKENDEKIATSGNCSEGMLYKTMYANNTIVNEFNIDTNTRTINVTKKWDMTNVPEEEKNALQYPVVKIKLYRYIGVEADTSTINKPENTSDMDLVETKIIKPDEIKKNTNGESTIAFTDLLIYSPRGDRYHYYVEEEKINGYSVAYTGDEITTASNNGIYITDKKTIQANGEGNSTDSPNFGTDGGWSSVIENNEVSAANGSAPIITVDPNAPLDEQTSTNETTNENNNEINVTNVTVTNTYDPKALNSIKGAKVWNDYNNYYGLRPDSIDLQLFRYTHSQAGYSNGVSRYELKSKAEDAEGLNKATERYLSWTNVDKTNPSWNYEFHNLAQYASNGQPYIYVVREVLDPIKDYYVNNGEVWSGTYANNTVTMSNITNRFDGTCEVKKHWIDGDNKYNFRPKSVTMKLQRRIKEEGAKWEDVLDPSNDSNVITKELTVSNVVANTKGNTWRHVFTGLTKKIKVDTDGDGKPDTAKPVEYQCVETQIGNTPFREGSNEIGAYVMSVRSSANNSTEIVNSMRTTDITVNVDWDDVDNYYQTRFGKVYVRLERRDQSPSTDWEQVTDVDGKPIVFEINSSNYSATDANGITTWKKKFDTLPVARVGAEGEESSVAIHYRAVLCTVQDSYYKHPQYVNVVKNGTSYSINPTKTYHNYDDVSEYDTTAWSYSDDSKTYNMNLDLRMITNEYANRDGKNRVYNVTADKKWCKDDDANYYAVDIELRKSNNGVSYASFPIKLTKRIEKDGSGVSWMKMPAFDEDGKDLTYKLYEITTNYWYRCHTDVSTSDGESGKIDAYTFTNIQLLDYKIQKTWNNNDRVLPTNLSRYVSRFKMQSKTGEEGTWEDLLDNNKNVVEREIVSSNRNNVSITSTTIKQLDKYTLDNKRIYYQAIETKVNNVDQGLNPAYTMTNSDEEIGGRLYTDNDSTEVTNTLRTISLNVKMNWDDADNHDNVRPTPSQTNKFNIAVYADLGSGYTKVSSSFYKLTWDTSVANVWTATIANMPKYTSDGRHLIKYKIVQSVVPPRYFITQEADIPTFDDAIDEYNYEIGNTLNLLVKLKKYDQVNGKVLKGTQFALYKYNEGTYAYDGIKNLTADASGNISMEFNELGEYKLVEIKAVKGYEDKLGKDGEPDPVDGSRFECYFIVENENLRQTVNINNTNTNEDMSRFEEQSLSASNNVNLGFSTASVPTLEPATPVVPTFSVTEGWGSLITSTGLVNLRKLGELSFSKQDVDTKAKLDGVTFELYKYANENGTGALNYLCDIESGHDYTCSKTGPLVVSEIVKDDTTGGVKISKLPWGKYVLRETKTLVGYALPSYDYTFVVNDSTVNDTTGRNENIYIQYNGKVVANNIITNSKTKFTFKKLGLNDKLLTGGTFKIVSNDGNDVQQSFWNMASDDASLKINILKSNNVVYGLPVGNYRIVETAVPYGYKVASDLAFSIDKYGNARNIANTKFSNNVVNFRDESIDVKIVNVDEDFATPLNGSRFELSGKFAMNYGSDISGEQTIDRTVSGEKWLIQEQILPSESGGTQYIYKLYQTNVPAGYEERDLPVYFKMDKNYKISLTDENGNVPSAELQEKYDLFVKIDNTSVPTIIFENLRIPKNDIYVDNGDNYLDPLGNILCKVFYAYDTFSGENALPVPKMGHEIRFHVDKSNLGLLDFAITTVKDGKDTSKYISSDMIKIYDPFGNEVVARKNMYSLKENVEYRLWINSDFLDKLETGSKFIYFYSHMPRIDDIEAVYIVRRTAFQTE